MNLVLNNHFPENVPCASTDHANVACVDSECCVEVADTHNFRLSYERRSIERS